MKYNKMFSVIVKGKCKGKTGPSCFPVAAIKHHDPKHLVEEGVSFGSQFQVDTSLSWRGSVVASRSRKVTSSSKVTLPKPHNSATIWDQLFKCLSLWVRFLIQTTIGRRGEGCW